MIIGKFLSLLFWLVVITNVFQPFAFPFEALLNLAGVVLFCLRVLEVLMLNRQLRQSSYPWRNRLWIVLFGVFHWYRLPTRSAPGH
ncbi:MULTISPECIES: DUF1145 domain-containing protein [unclassified Pseudomonas]|nr:MULTISPECIES: DUF1145 domain-containing protein [unclassified Pseudomonas]